MKNKTIIIKISESDKKLIVQKAKHLNFTSVSEYIRFIALNTDLKIEVNYNSTSKNKG